MSNPVLHLKEFIDVETAGHAGKGELRLWLRMLASTNLIEAEIRARLRNRFDITLPQFDLMAQLYRAPKSGLTMSALGEQMMVSRGNITGITDRLEREGYAERVRSKTDRRSQNVRLTDLGRRYFETMADEHESWIISMFDSLNLKDRENLFKLMARLKASVISHRFDGDGK